MSNHMWRAASAGVMLWEPAPAATTAPVVEEVPKMRQSHTITGADVQVSMTSSHDEGEQEPGLPSLEDIFEPRIRNGIEQSPSTIGCSSPVSTFPDHGELRLDIPSSAISRSSFSPVILGYESNCTDLLLTPCPPNSEPEPTSRLRELNQISHHFQPSNTTSKPKPVRRLLEFNMKQSNTVDVIPRSEEPSNLQSLDALQKLERAPIHSWEEDERELLTILYRWYDNTDPSTIPKVFNAITGLDLRLSVVRYQFESHMLLYGGRAFPEFARAMAVPLHDPEGKYDQIRLIIEDTATEFGIDLLRRKTEVRFNSGAARHAKSPRTRRAYKSLVRRAVLKEKEKARAAWEMPIPVQRPIPQELPRTLPPVGRVALSVDSRQEDGEKWSDVEDCRNLVTNSLVPRPTEPLSTCRVAFRVWDANSRTLFDEGTGFVSQAFSIWRNEYPPPFSLKGQGRQALMLLTNLHLSMKGGASAFVSLSTSLLQALVKASTMDNPRIAVVALDHPLLTEPNKTLLAADVLRMLKDDGQAWWAKYKGYAERMVWASVPAAAILSHFPLLDLQLLSDDDQICTEILNLDEIRAGRRTRYVSARMREKGNTINAVTARAMASISKAFGMNREGVGLLHVTGLVACLVDSFQLLRSPVVDGRASSSIAHAFAMTLRSRSYTTQDVMKAFLEGVQQGSDTVAFYSRKRPRSS
ncbi:hypothetical protein DDE82_000874 [Stemphylium lycopersici]|nr:hypothetical protein DDE82_000874 [Stemphylium lycopersici]